MYLKQIQIKNIGPIESLAISLPFLEDGTPKPIIFVGENGSGKTILQSQIIDAFYEIGSNLFNDIGIPMGIKRQFYKISGGSNLQSGKKSGFSLLRFQSDSIGNIDYFDKIGEVIKEEYHSFISNLTFNLDKNEQNQKIITKLNNRKLEEFKNEWITGVHFLQPAYRYEEPFWKNDPFIEKFRFEDKIRFSGNLYKELEIISSTKNNKSFLMDLVLDYSNNQRNILDAQSWDNINTILKKIKKRNNIRFGIGPRGSYRVAIVEQNLDGTTENLLLPSIDNLSLGESILLNLFINIIRHGDSIKLPLNEFKGIVAIDEIDVHLHSDLQWSVLPDLIKIFPKIQFIITTHSPLFLLGLKKTLGEDGFEIRKMPSGDPISTERFSEFEHAYNILKDTEKFENLVEEKIIESKGTIVYVEGPTDAQYIKRAFELFNVSFEKFEVDIIGEKTNSGTNSSNNHALLSTERILKSKLNLLKHKVILLNDPEENVIDHEFGNLLFIRKIPLIKENPLCKGIENLFNSDVIEKVRKIYPDDFSYLQKGDTILNFKIHSNKQSICNWLCQHATKEDFKYFQNIIEIFQNIIQLKDPEMESI